MAALMFRPPLPTMDDTIPLPSSPPDSPSFHDDQPAGWETINTNTQSSISSSLPTLPDTDLPTSAASPTATATAVLTDLTTAAMSDVDKEQPQQPESDKAEVKLTRTQRQIQERKSENEARKKGEKPRLPCAHTCCTQKNGDKPWDTHSASSLSAHELNETFHSQAQCSEMKCPRHDMLWGGGRVKRQERIAKKRPSDSSTQKQTETGKKGKQETPYSSISSSSGSTEVFNTELFQSLDIVYLPPLLKEVVVSSGEAAAPKGKKGKPAADKEEVVTKWVLNDEVFMEQAEVKQVLRSKRVVVFVIDPSQEPLVVEDAHRPRHLSKLYNSPVSVYGQALMAINVPSLDRPKQPPQQWSSIHNPNREGLTEQALHDALTSKRGGAIRHHDYMQDIEGLRVWNADDEAAVPHFLNAQLFSSHSSSLFTLIEKDLEGITMPSFYNKINVSFYRMHYEQCYFSFLNYCFQGASVWYFVMDSDGELLNRFVVKKVCELLRVAKLDEADEKLCALLVCTKQLMFSPTELVKGGVPVYRHVQRAGEVVMGRGNIAHWGVVSGQSACQMAINVCGVEWLEDGLPQLLEHLNLVVQYFEAKERVKAGNSALYDILYEDIVSYKIRHLTLAKHLLRPFLKAVQSDLKKGTPPARYKVLRDINKTKEVVASALTLINMSLFTQAE